MSDNIIAMAREAFAEKYREDPADPSRAHEWRIFLDGFQLSAAAEREACALVCDDKAAVRASSGLVREFTAARACAAAIRERKSP